MKQVIDNFATGGSDYALYRPQSPGEIFEFLYAHVNGFGAAWDCGTGNGQVAVRLAERFETVYGTDISADQLSHTVHKSNIIYRQERAEATTIPDHSVDLVTVAQAIHWFDFDAFYKEVNRVCKPGALIAAWTYSTLRLTPEVNVVIDHFHDDIIGPYWSKESALVEAGYRTIPFPFEQLQAPEIKMSKPYALHQLTAYLRTWSGVIKYVAKEHKDPLALIQKDLEAAWGSSETLTVNWPMHMRVARVR